MNAVFAEIKTRLEAVKSHLRGVRQRLLWVTVFFGLGCSLTGYHNKTIIGWLLAPAHERLSATGQPVFTVPTDMVTVVAQVVITGGIAAALPMLVFHVVWLLSPLLSKRHLRFIALFAPLVFVCFLTGASFAYFILLPAGLGFLLQFGTDVAQPMIRIVDYMDLAMAMLFWLGVVFELPLAMFLLAKLRLVGYQRFKGLRRYVAVATPVFGGIITPGADPVSWILVAVPLFLLYEVGLGLSWLVRPKQVVYSTKVARRRKHPATTPLL